MSNRDENNQIAKLAEQAERYDEMAESMTKIVMSGCPPPLTTEERNLFSVAYKNVVGSKRSSWRIVTALEQKGGDIPKEVIENYRKRIEKDLNETCDKVIDLLDKHLIANADEYDVDSQIFYLKMKGDYLRYKVEVIPNPGDDQSNELVKHSAAAYQKAYDIAIDKAKPTDPIRLGLALNYSVFYYEILKDSGKACKLADDAFKLAMDALPQEEDNHSYKDSTLILQLLRDNLTLWMNESEGQETLEDYDGQELVDDQ